MSTNKQQPMRRSCQFCRLRKIRCSGTDCCDACAQRNQECVYSREALKGRPRKQVPTTLQSSSPRATSELHPTTVRQGSVSNTSKGRRLSAPGAAVGPAEEDVQSGVREPSVTDDLRDTFLKQNFGLIVMHEDQGTTHNQAIATFGKKALSVPDDDTDLSPRSTGTTGTSPGTTETRTPAMRYDDFVVMMTQDLVEMICLKFGRLGCEMSTPAAKFYVRAQKIDTSETAFPTAHNTDQETKSPVDALNDKRIMQLIEIFFATHPLVPAFSKTLILDRFNTHNLDEILLSTIIGCALYMQDPILGNMSGDDYLNYAVFLMRSKPASTKSLELLQATLLISWHYLALGKARQSTCFISYTSKYSGILADQTYSVRLTSRGMLHEFSIYDVELQLLKNLQWYLAIFKLWGFMQFDHSYGQFLPPPSITSSFLPLDAAKSIVNQLDQNAGNISTMKHQYEMSRSLYIMGKITLTIGNVYALYPCPTPPSTNVEPWHASIEKLRNMNQPSQKMSVLCASIRNVLKEAADQFVQAAPIETDAQTILLSVQQLLIIHLIFYRDDQDAIYEINSQMVVDFLNCATRLITLTRRCFSTEIRTDEECYVYLGNLTPHTLERIVFSNLVVLIIDTCMRALNHIFRDIKRGIWTDSHLQVSLANLSKNLVALSKTDVLQSVSRNRIVKKNMKIVASEYERWATESQRFQNTSLSGDDFDIGFLLAEVNMSDQTIYNTGMSGSLGQDVMTTKHLDQGMDSLNHDFINSAGVNDSTIFDTDILKQNSRSITQDILGSDVSAMGVAVPSANDYNDAQDIITMGHLIGETNEWNIDPQSEQLNAYNPFMSPF